MSIVSTLVKARGEMAQLVTDEMAKMGSYSFRYVTLAHILKTVQPALLENKVLLRQDVTSDVTGTVTVETLLLTDGDTMRSGKLTLVFDGTPIDLGKKATSMRRVQLLGFLGMAADDDEQAPEDALVTTIKGKEIPRIATPPPPAYKLTADDIARRVAAAEKGRVLVTLPAFIETMRTIDSEDSTPMPTTIREGKTSSMYGYLCGLVDKAVGVKHAHIELLSSILGRVVSQEAPPKMGHKFLIDDIQANPLHEGLTEAWRYLHDEDK